MASTLITRFTQPSLLTSEQRTAVTTELGISQGASLKLGIHWLVAMNQEILAGRVNEKALQQRLTVAERADMNKIRNRLSGRSVGIEVLANILYLGEDGTYSPQDIERILSL